VERSKFVLVVYDVEVLFINIVVFFGCFVNYADYTVVSEEPHELAELYGSDNYWFFYLLSNKNHDAFTSLRMVLI
jgi:hypothetical protein